MNEEFSEDFIKDTIELLEVSETCFFKIEAGESLISHFDTIFRCLHSVKGSAGMFHFSNIAEAIHRAEQCLGEAREINKIEPEKIKNFLFMINKLKVCIQNNDKESSIEIATHCENKGILALKAVEFEDEADETETDGESYLFHMPTLKKELENCHRPIILLVDDEPGVHKLLNKMMPTAPLIINALNVKQSKKVLSLCKPHLIITDVKMPGESGIDLLKSISEKHHDIPVIMISGNASTESTIEALNSGAIHFLEKPFTKTDLQTAIRKGLLKRMRNYISNVHKKQASGS